MIEAATGIAFLMSSLYGAGQASAQTASAATPVTIQAPAAIVQNMRDSKQIEAYVRKEFSETPILIEVARCESTFRQYGSNGEVIRGKVNKADVGVMQINEAYHADEAEKAGIDIYSVEGNVTFAKRLYAKFGTSPWSSSEKCWSAGSNLAAK